MVDGKPNAIVDNIQQLHIPLEQGRKWSAGPPILHGLAPIRLLGFQEKECRTMAAALLLEAKCD